MASTPDDRILALERVVPRIEEGIRWLTNMGYVAVAAGVAAAGTLFWQNVNIEKTLVSIETRIDSRSIDGELNNSIQELIQELRASRINFMPSDDEQK